MRYLFYLALKNILRAKRRSVLTFLILSFGVGFNILLSGITDGFGNESINNLIAFESGHFKIRSEKFNSDIPHSLENLISDTRELIDKLSNLNFVRGITERLLFSGELDNGFDSLHCTVTGIDFENDEKVFNLKKYISKGYFDKECLIIGKNLAEDMGITIESDVFLTLKNRYGELDSIEMTVSGIVNSQDPQVNQSTVYISLSKAKEIIDFEGITEITILTENKDKYKEYYPQISYIAEGMNIQSWREMGDYLIKINQADRFGNNLFVIFITLIASVGVINTMIMSILEKKREIGTLKALGMENRHIVWLFVFEGTVMGIIGGLFGIILGVLLNGYFAIYGLDITAMMGQTNANIGYKVLGTVYSVWNINIMIYSVAVCVVICSLASYIPARKAVSYEASETLRVK